MLAPMELPSAATAARGATLYGWMVEDLAVLVSRGLLERPPLPHAYAARTTTT